MSEDWRRSLGEQLLQIYFAQLLSPGPQFLDFRLTHFAWATENAVLEWRPSSAQIAFDEKFLRGIRDVYRGFYGHRDSQFVAGFETLGILSPDTAPAVREKTVAAFKRHLLGADTGLVVFSTEKFTASFRELFAILAEEDTKLSPDFAVFGLMLASLHVALEFARSRLITQRKLRAAGPVSEVTRSREKPSSLPAPAGFVGSALARRLTARYRVICLSRVKKESRDPQFRSGAVADLFSLIDAEAGLAGAEIAYYLVHSMMPSARLTQGSFEDLIDRRG